MLIGYAAFGGQLELLKYMHNHAFGWHKNTSQMAAAGGHLDCLKCVSVPLPPISFSSSPSSSLPLLNLLFLLLLQNNMSHMLLFGLLEDLLSPPPSRLHPSSSSLFYLLSFYFFSYPLTSISLRYVHENGGGEGGEVYTRVAVQHQ
jgi:hypothetical protein